MRIRPAAITLAEIGVLILLAAVPAWAHHAFAAEFDSNSPLTFSGTVVKVEWINPHAWFHIDVKQSGGKVVRWMVEAGTPNALFRRGFTKNALLPGTAIKVDGYRAKDGSNRMNGRDMTLSDGQTLFMGSSGTGSRDK